MRAFEFAFKHSRQFFERRFPILPERLARLWQVQLAICRQPSSRRHAAGTWCRPTLKTNAGTEFPLAPTHPRAYNHTYAERVENRAGTRMKPLSNRKLDGILSLVWALGGLLALKLGGFHSDSPILHFFIVFGAWWGVAMLLGVSGLRSRSWPSIVTGLATVLIFLWLVWTSIPRGHSHRAPVAVAMTQIFTFKTALEAFQADNGFYPTGRDALQALVKQPAGTTNWRGPYVSFDSIPRDPWGNDYLYECPSRHNSNSYDISSPGPPRANAPIANWECPGLRP